MLIIKNNIIPFKGFCAMNLFGILFVRNGCTANDRLINHESIHTQQQKEMLFVFFYIWYVIEWLVRLVIERDSHKAYKKISFEQEAYFYESNKNYLDWRTWFSWWKFLKQ